MQILREHNSEKGVILCGPLTYWRIGIILYSIKWIQYGLEGNEGEVFCLVMNKISKSINKFFEIVDRFKLGYLGFLLMGIVFLPYVFMGENSVFPWHDQLDENMLHYIIPARHLADGTRVYPEMMNGVRKSSLTPYGALFVPLYCIFSSYSAFVIQYAIIFAIAFFGTYALLRHVTKSSILAFVCAGLFSMLPFYPVYGASVASIPMVFYAILLLEEKKHVLKAYCLALLYAVASFLFFTGYTVIFLWACCLLYSLLKERRINKPSLLCLISVICVFIFLNLDLFVEFLGLSGNITSTRQEYVAYPFPVLSTFLSIFFEGGDNAESLAKYIVFPILAVNGAGILMRKRLSVQQREMLKISIQTLILILVCCILASFFKSQLYTDFKNNSNGFLHSFQMDRFYWLLPGLWWIELGFSSAILWPEKGRAKILALIVFIVILLPSFKLIKENSYFYMVVNQYNNGTSITGYIPWNAYYSRDVMEAIDEAIGEEKESYRIAHIGMNPTPALAYGFYTIDGYANSYELEYKHQFRKIMQAELDSAPIVASYFDDWGSRCYLFSSQSGTAFMLGKNANVKFEKLRFDWNAMKEMGAGYIFSAGEIVDYASQGLEYMGYFSSDTSYWGIYLYKL